MPFLILFLPATVVWGVGTFLFYKTNYENFYLFASLAFILFYFILVIALFAFNPKKTFSNSNLIPPKKLLLFAYIITFFLVISATLQILLVIKYSQEFGYDYARFYVRSLPLFGFLSRIEYWWAISLSPILAYLIYFGLSKLKLFIFVICLLCVELASGSKAGVVWFILSFVLSFLFFRGINYFYYRRLKKLLTLMVVFSFLLMFGAFWLYSGSEIVPAINGLLYRLNFGAIEGLLYVKNYVHIQGYSFPEFSVVRPIEVSLSSFRIIEKDYLNSVDTGVYLARYFGRENDLASWTISWVGLGYLELGWYGTILTGMSLLSLIIVAINIVYRSASMVIKFFGISILVMLAHFIDWGWSDGIVIFSLVYILLFYLLLLSFLTLMPWKSRK